MRETNAIPTDILAESGQEPQARNLARYIDHTKLTFTQAESACPQDEQNAIRALCDQAIAYGFKAVCVRPRFTRLAKDRLRGSEILVAIVIGFPLQKSSLEREKQHPQIGAVSFEEKYRECQKALEDGADEIDFVLDVARLKQDVADNRKTSANAKSLDTPDDTLTMLERLGALCHSVPVKVIIETDLLSEEEIYQASQWCAHAKMAMVKTSTGMLEDGIGASIEVVALIRKALWDYAQTHPKLTCDQPAIGIKASGGIKNKAQTLSLIAAGATRIGSSHGITILSEE